jgi:proline iminopeptidase
MVLAAVTMTRRTDIHWLYHEVGRYFPEEWAAFRGDRAGNLVAAYHQLLNVQPDAALREAAALAWCRWEDAVLSLEPGWRPHPRYQDPAFRITFARTCTHYFHHGAWLAEGQLLRDAHRLAGIPAVLIHGRLDLGGPLDTAWELARAWPDAELQVVGTGHGGGAEMTERIVAATGRFAGDA